MHRRVPSVIVLFLVGSFAATAPRARAATKDTADTADESTDEPPTPKKSSSSKNAAKKEEKGDEKEDRDEKDDKDDKDEKPPHASAAAADGVGIPPAQEPLKLEAPSGNGSSIRFGFLIQPQFEAATSIKNDLQGWGFDLFLHRARFIVGGTLFHDFEFFMDTDFPDLFKQGTAADQATGSMVYVKKTPGLNLQDMFVTYKAAGGDSFKVDAGYMLPPMSHNAIQGAGTQYGIDYFANTFLHSNAFGTSTSPSSNKDYITVPTPVGRDLGVQLRGLLFGGHIEYRAGMFQGLRADPLVPDMPITPGGRNMFRVTGRLQINFLDPETGFFYAGSYLGTKRILSVGASGDIQGSYKYWAWDALLDLPLGPGVVTGQVNLAQWDGGTLLPRLPKERALMVEAGYLIGPIRLSPIGRYEQRWVASTATMTAQQERHVGGGLAFWPYGHNSNIKAFFMRGTPTFPDNHAFSEFHLQWQFYFF